MKLYIHLKSSPAVSIVRAPDYNAPAPLPDFTHTDHALPVEIVLTRDRAVADESADPAYAVEVALGVPGAAPVAFSDNFVIAGDGWAGTLNLSTAEAAAAIGAPGLRFGVLLTGPAGFRKTIAQVPARLAGPVIDGETYPGASLPEAVLRPAGTPLTTARIPFANASGQLIDSARLIWANTSERLRVGATLGHNVVSILRALISAPSPASVFDVTMSLEAEETTGAADTGACLGFQGHDGSGGRLWGWIRGFKANSTVGNPDSYLAFAARSSAGIAERLRIHPNGLRLAASAAPGTPVAGDIWHQDGDGLRGWMNNRTITFAGKLATQTAARTFSNLSTEQTLFGTIGQGSLTLPASFWSVGKMARLTLRGNISWASGDLTLRIKLGSTTITSILKEVNSGVTSAPFTLEAILTCRSTGASGSIAGTVDLSFVPTTGTFTLSPQLMAERGNGTVNTTQSAVLDVTGQFATAAAGNGFAIEQAVVEAL